MTNGCKSQKELSLQHSSVSSYTDIH